MTVVLEAPETFDQAAGVLRAATADSRTVRIVGAGTKLSWGNPTAPADVELSTRGLGEIVAHDPGDMTATLQAGVSLPVAQRRFAAAGQMLALDPPPAVDGREATIGGVVATADCGPLRHRYGAPRDLVVGATVALADGTIARSGGTVIKNVAGYDVARLLCGAFGTLGVVLSVNVRLHPRPGLTATATGHTTHPATLTAAAIALAALPAELACLDVAWRHGRGRLLARLTGPHAPDRARRVATAIRDTGLHDTQTIEDDEPVWARQRAGQRSQAQAIVRVAALPTQLAAVIGAVEQCAGGLVGRAAFGHSYIEVAPDTVARLRHALPAGAVSTVLDTPAGAATTVSDRWGETPAPALALMRRLKARFDPTGTCNPGLFVGGI